MDTISIVGGGIAGLTLAATLDPARWSISVHERAPHRPPAGTSLAMWPDVMAALESIGVADAVRRHSRVMDRFEIIDGAGRPLLVSTGRRAHLVSRPHLLAALDAAVPASVVRTEEHVDDPATLPAGLIVGADGVHSVVRQTLFRGGPARPLGIVALRGLSPVATTRVVEIWADGALCGLSPTASGASNWYLAHRGTDVSADAAALAESFGPEAVEVIGATPPDEVLRQQVWVTPPRWRLTSGRAALIGDAAHAMAPNLGRGACEAIHDAVTLGRALNTMPPPEALKHYQRTRAGRSQAIRAASGLAMRLSMLQRGSGLRDRLLRLRPSH